jgi:hypothetical protein
VVLREQGTGNREQGMGNNKQGTGNGKDWEGLGNNKQGNVLTLVVTAIKYRHSSRCDGLLLPLRDCWFEEYIKINLGN